MRAASSFSGRCGKALSNDQRNAKRIRAIAEWLLATSRAEIERAVDAVQRTRSDIWFRRMFHLWCVEGASQQALSKECAFRALPAQEAYALIRRPLRPGRVQEPNRLCSSSHAVRGKRLGANPPIKHGIASCSRSHVNRRDWLSPSTAVF